MFTNDCSCTMLVILRGVHGYRDIIIRHCFGSSDYSSACSALIKFVAWLHRSIEYLIPGLQPNPYCSH